MPLRLLPLRRFATIFAGLAAGLLSAATAGRAAEDPALPEIRKAWAACEAVLAKAGPEGWVGWRRDFGNGYGDAFAFWDRRDDKAASVLRITLDIDGIARQVETSCFRPDGSLAFLFTTLTAPLADAPGGPETGRIARREGRIYFDPKGAIVQVLGRIVDAAGKPLGRLDDPKLALVRDCRPVMLHRSADQAAAHAVSVLGDIEGKRPAFEPESLDWCARARAQ